MDVFVGLFVCILILSSGYMLLGKVFREDKNEKADVDIKSVQETPTLVKKSVNINKPVVVNSNSRSKSTSRITTTRNDDDLLIGMVVVDNISDNNHSTYGYGSGSGYDSGSSYDSGGSSCDCGSCD